MLIDKGVAVGEVVTLKLTSGEEIIGKLVDDTADCHIKISKPMVIAMGQQGPGLVPYLFTVSPDKTIRYRDLCWLYLKLLKKAMPMPISKIPQALN